MTMKTITKLVGREAVASCPLESGLPGTGAAVRPAASRIRERSSARPIQAPEVAAAAVDCSDAAHGAGNQLFGHQKTQLCTMWALRGLDPWSDPT
ncbi:hypothetical protein PJ985_04620 [Streptomyces sp. ACA25]|uniref:hypothetical protein n=1 Tax=Streptomyces sp. ACA25 TaxID=3022596 RepID=UPI0023077271|nr:hypothetical protein [Streptomyces sp. ACA25]MDB1086846.1 hypothetical protein [Streptomyces sp. ACA25]